MEQLQRKYAEVLLKNCLKVEKEQLIAKIENESYTDSIIIFAVVVFPEELGPDKSKNLNFSYKAVGTLESFWEVCYPKRKN